MMSATGVTNGSATVETRAYFDPLCGDAIATETATPSVDDSPSANARSATTPPIEWAMMSTLEYFSGCDLICAIKVLALSSTGPYVSYGKAGSSPKHAIS